MVPSTVVAETIVLGAGPAGLMAACQAAKAGHHSTVLEASDAVGGMAGSFELAGQRVDYGSHRLHPATDPDLLLMIGDLLGSDLQRRPRSGRIHLGGRWVGFPLQTTNLLRSLPPTMTFKLAGDSVAGLARSVRNGRTDAAGPPPGGGGPALSFDHEVRRRLGSTVAREFYGPYAKKLYGRRPDELSGELAARRVSAGSPVDIAKRLARASRPTGRTFFYPRGGYGQISERLAEAAVDAGATIKLRSPVTAVAAGSDRATVTADQTTVDTDTVLSTIPITTLAAMLEPAPPAPVLPAIDRLLTRAMILVYLVIDRPQYTRFDAHYLPGPETTVARLSEPKNYRDGDDPTDTTVLCAEIACWPTDELWHWDAQDLCCLVADDLERVGLPRTNHVAGEVKRLPSVYPVLDITGAEDRAIVDRWINSGPTDRVISLGRQGLRAIDNLHHVLEMGQAAAASVGGDGAVDLNRWRADLERFTTNTVED